MTTEPEYIENEAIQRQAIRFGQQAVSADVYTDHALVYLGDGQVATIDYPFTNDNHSTLNMINARLREENIPVLCWRFRWLGGERAAWVSIENESALVHAESALWDENNFQLVAAVFSGDKQITKAVMATLMTNSDKIKGWIKQGYTRVCDLASAKRRYTQVSRSLADANASGTALAVLHPLTGNPRESNHDHFYVVATPGEDLVQKLRERLDMATSLALLPAWADYLLTAGREAGLVRELCGFGPTFVGLCVSKKPYGENGWEAVISAGLRQGTITI
jgi:hypothetical protein